ncbi:MAG: serine hydrolase domain-containing protein [Flavobacteriales bacterium]
MKLISIVIFLIGFGIHSGSAQNTKAFKKKMNFWMSWYHIPGAQIVFIKDGKIDYSYTFGSLEYKKDQKVTPNTKFQVGKVNQIFTGLALMRTFSDKTVSKYKPINEQIKGYKLRESVLTKHHKTLPNQLLNHSGGINRPTFEPLKENIEISTLDLLKGSKLTGKKKIHNFQTPLKSYRYSEGGFVIAKYLIEENSGQSFGEYLNTYILPQIKSPYRTNGFEIPRHERALGYDYSKWKAKDALSYPNPSGFGMWMSAKEYAQLVLEIFENKELPNSIDIKEREFESFLTPVIKIKDTPFSSCAVFEKHDYEKGIYRLQHKKDGFRSTMYYDTESKEGFIILMNSEFDYFFRKYDGKVMNKFQKFASKFKMTSIYSKINP